MVAGLLSPAPVTIIRRSNRQDRKSFRTEQKGVRVVGNLGHLFQVVRNDVNFLKDRISDGAKWANKTFHVPQLSKAVDDVIWLRNIEDPHAPPLPSQSWPQPYYPELSAMDLLMADLRALEVYASYFYYLSKSWTRPLPEIYDPEEVAAYFNLRPHVVALRLVEVLGSFAFAAVRIRTSGLRKSNKDVHEDSFGVVLKETMLSLGPTFIKVGQSLSTRPDIIGSEISKALSELHDKIPPFPRTMAMKVVEEELSCPLESSFSQISEEPVAAASFGQVYKARTVDGLTVAVKVQRPNLLHVVVRDIYILRLGLGLLQKITKRKSDLRLYADELGKGLVGELDYTLEAANAAMFMKAHAPFPFIRVPKVYSQLSRKKVLTMEWMDGESPSNLVEVSTADSNKLHSSLSKRQQKDAKRRLLSLVNKGVQASLVQLLETGIMHADPHPGNLRYTPSGDIGFLDFGLLCRMEKKHQFAMLASIVHIVNGDWASLVLALTDMDVVRPGTNIRRVTLDLELALGEVELKDGIPDVKFSKVLGKIWSVAIKYHFRMPPYYTLVLRSLASLEGLAVAGDPDFKTFEAAYPYVVQKLLTDNSAATRKILHSVVFNRRREFRWQRLALFLRVGATRKVIHQVLAPNVETNNSATGTSGVFNIANLILRVLPSKDGIVYRRLLMTADGASLIRTIISKEASVYRQQACRIIADVIYQWMSEALGRGTTISRYSSQIGLDTAPGNGDVRSSSTFSATMQDYRKVVGDRRLKVIFLKTLDSARQDPMLMLRLSWASLVMLITASALACHRMLVTLSEAYLGPIFLKSKSFAMSS